MKNKKEYMMYAIMKVLEENYQVDLSTVKGRETLELSRKTFEKKCKEKNKYYEKAKDFFELLEIKGSVNLEDLLAEHTCVINFLGKMIAISAGQNSIVILVGEEGEIIVGRILEKGKVDV